MNKIIILVLSIIAITLAQQNQCATPAFTSFCASTVTLNPNHTIDSIFNQYASTAENVLSSIWGTWQQKIEQIGQKYDFDVCTDCLTALKHSICSALIPNCGFMNCIQTLSNQVGECVNECSTQCTAENAASQGCNICQTNCIAEIYDTTCPQFLMSKTSCASVVNTCACSPGTTVVNEVCQYFPDNGFTMNFPAGLSCSATDDWCETANGDDKRRATSQPGVVRVNSHLSLMIPQSTNNQNIGDPVVGESSQTSASSTIIPTFFAALVAYWMLN